MKKKILLLIAVLFSGIFASSGQVIISQIYEGTSFNKFIEITNLGSSPVSLTGYSLKLFSNKSEIGANTPTGSYDLAGTLSAGQCFLLRHGSATTPSYGLTYTPGDTSSKVANFNGLGTGSPVTNTDIIALYNGATLVDVFAWGTFQYSNQSYYRNAVITAPNTTFTEGEWTTVTNAVVDGAALNTIERLGYHLAGGVTTPTILISSPIEGATLYSADVNVAYTLYNFVMNTDGHIHYTLDAGSPVEYTSTSPISLTGLAGGAHKVVITLVDAAHNALVPNAADSVNFTVNLIPPAYKTIYQIQYTTLPTGDSPLMDSIVTTSGVVTASYVSGYFIQDGTTPWNGLYVFDNTHTPALGDSITLVGTVSEYYNYTELKTIASLITNASGKPVPAPLLLTTASVKSEQYEGMLVNLNNAKCTQNSAAGWWKVLQATDTCEIGKLMYPFPTAVVGTYYDVTGCVNYTFNQFTVEPRDVNDVQVHVGISESAEQTFSIYPNPVSANLNISNIEGIDQVNVSNLLGETIMTQKVTGNTSSLNVAKLQSGIYFVTFIKDNSIAGTRKFIKF
jgi:predicted extracellular nuclease